ncbi:helix-turn-helix domain-containing protein [Sphingomonas desiccabilis]|uniref:XRE family transcriptional regulator n=1 Tax=Sphingomonas desiccabilis TaxID=429134 RepID=A0A4Q2IXS7_9SPHN|nr:helix-turn-helix transcriptional regulator [Sphingomonas desiccabilis]MBB3910861.1 transcriptional regulator with XRE-family HTH domain [Sphingomonas desiccabilis]RXZ35465.1 XRE family transcriptional regulator [Sphingomonas desiccabilis]
MSTALADYMARQRITDAEFASLIGKDRSLVNRMRRGEARPTLEVAAQIEVSTNGEVPMQAWIAKRGEQVAA